MQALSLRWPAALGGLARPGRTGRWQPAAAFKVTIQNSLTSEERVLDVNPDEFILDIAEVAGMDLPYTCRTGACSSCAGRIVGGKVDQDLVDGALTKFLMNAHEGRGFIMLCVAKPKTDCTIVSHQEEFLY